MTHYALIEEGSMGRTAYFRELPGCVVFVPAPEDIEPKLRPAIVDHLKWLAQWGLAGPASDDLDVVVAERLPRVKLATRSVGPLFESDKTAPTTAELEEALRVASLARAALLSAYSNIPLDRRDVEPAPGEWSPRRQLSHVAGSEVWYADALVQPGEGTQVDLPPDPVAALEISAAHAEAVLRSLTPEAATQVIERAGEQWTAAKVIRRMVGHLREHYAAFAAS